MTREYTIGFVHKHKGSWRAVIKWQEGDRQSRLTKSTGVRCYEDRVDERTGEQIRVCFAKKI